MFFISFVQQSATTYKYKKTINFNCAIHLHQFVRSFQLPSCCCQLCAKRFFFFCCMHKCLLTWKIYCYFETVLKVEESSNRNNYDNKRLKRRNYMLHLYALTYISPKKKRYYQQIIIRNINSPPTFLL